MFIKISKLVGKYFFQYVFMEFPDLFGIAYADHIRADQDGCYFIAIYGTCVFDSYRSGKRIVLLRWIEAH